LGLFFFARRGKGERERKMAGVYLTFKRTEEGGKRRGERGGARARLSVRGVARKKKTAFTEGGKRAVGGKKKERWSGARLDFFSRS